MLRTPLNDKERNMTKQITRGNGCKLKTMNKLENKIKHKLTKHCLLYTSHVYVQHRNNYYIYNKY